MEEPIKNVEINLKPREIIIDFTNNKRNTVLEIDYIKIYLEKHFNWFQKKMWNLILGIDIKENK